jgi:hypothetical protein
VSRSTLATTSGRAIFVAAELQPFRDHARLGAPQHNGRLRGSTRTAKRSANNAIEEGPGEGGAPWAFSQTQLRRRLLVLVRQDAVEGDEGGLGFITPWVILGGGWINLSGRIPARDSSPECDTVQFIWSPIDGQRAGFGDDPLRRRALKPVRRQQTSPSSPAGCSVSLP